MTVIPGAQPNTQQQRRIPQDAPLLLCVFLLVIVGTIWAARGTKAFTVRVGGVADRLVLERTDGVGGTNDGAWFGDELAPGASHGRSRWSQGSSTLCLPIAGSATVAIESAGWPGAVTQPTVTVRINGTQIGTYQPSESFATEQFSIPASLQDGTTSITLQTSGVLTDTVGYRDPRQKGIRVAAVTLRAGPAAHISIPIWRLFVWICAPLVLAFLVLVRWRVRSGIAIGTVSALTLLLAVIAHRAAVWVAVVWYVPAIVCGVLVVVLYGQRVRQYLGSLRRRVRGSVVLSAAVWLGCVTAGFWLLRAVVYGQHPWWQVLSASVPLVMVGLARLGWLRRIDPVLLRSGAVLRWVVSVALAGTVVFFVLQAPFIGHADYADNAVVARNLVNGRGWMVDYVTQFYEIYPTVTHPQETWPILQPVWIAVSFLLFGISDSAARVPNAVFWALTAWTLSRFAQQRWGSTVALFSVILFTMNVFVFRQLVYATTDIAFVCFATAACIGVWRLAVGFPDSDAARVHQPTLRSVLVTGGWTGLMLLQKPGSAAMLALGMGIWLVLVWVVPVFRERPLLLRRFGFVAVWAGSALVVLSPYVLRNIVLYGSPAHSTEAYDAWILEYTHWDAIYRVYAADGGIGSGDLPERSWVLRWGFDAIWHKLLIQYTVLQDYLLPSFALLPAPFTTLGAAAAATGLLAPLGMWFAAMGVVLPRRTPVPAFRTLIGAALVPYVIFMTTYWHANEPRYWVILIPWMAVAAAHAMVWLVQRVLGQLGVVSPSVHVVWISVLLLVCVAPIAPTLRSTWELDATRTAADRDMYAFLRTQTDPDAVMMTRVPWQLQWYSARGAVMIPADADAETILRIAQHYRVRYLVLDSLQRPNSATRATIASMIADPRYGFSPVYQTRAYPVNDNGRAFTMQSDVYAFPPDYAGVKPIR